MFENMRVFISFIVVFKPFFDPSITFPDIGEITVRTINSLDKQKPYQTKKSFDKKMSCDYSFNQ